MDAGQLLADGTDEQGGHHGGVHAARKSQQYLFIAHLCPDFLYLLFDEGFRQSRGGDALHIGGSYIVCHDWFLPYFSKNG